MVWGVPEGWDSRLFCAVDPKLDKNLLRSICASLQSSTELTPGAAETSAALTSLGLSSSVENLSCCGLQKAGPGISNPTRLPTLLKELPGLAVERLPSLVKDGVGKTMHASPCTAKNELSSLLTPCNSCIIHVVSLALP